VSSGVFLNVELVDTGDPDRVPCRDTKEAIQNAVDLQNRGVWKPLNISDAKTGEILLHTKALKQQIDFATSNVEPIPIDWTKPIYSDGRQMVPSPEAIAKPDTIFKSLIFEDDPYQIRWYYNEDGSPFEKNPHIISNFEIAIEQSEFNRQREAQREAEFQRTKAEKEAMERSPLWGAF
jgi:hypothetical protein